MCQHTIVKCLCCGAEGSPASLIGKGKKKTMSPAAVSARKANASKPRPKKPKPPLFGWNEAIQQLAKKPAPSE